MSAAIAPPPPLHSSRVVIDLENGQALRAASRAGIDLALWRRSLPAAVRADADAAMAGGPAMVTLEATTGALAAALADAGVRQALAADIAMLADHFAAATGATDIAVRLERIETDACHRYHADYVAMRLLTTYVGAGTEWLDVADADRLAAGADPGTLTPNRLSAGDIALFKGRLATASPVIHRSPPILASGAARLLLVIDTVRLPDLHA